MAVIEWRGNKLRFEPDTLTDLTMGEAKVVQRASGMRVGAWAKAVQDMVNSAEIDAVIMQSFLWLLLRRNGAEQDMGELDDVPLNEWLDAFASLDAEERPAREPVDPTTADVPVSGAPPNGSSNGSSTLISNGDDPNTCSNSPTTAISVP